MIVLQFNMQGDDIIEHTNGKCHLCTFQSTCRPLCNIVIHLITLLNTLVLEQCPRVNESPADLDQDISKGYCTVYGIECHMHNSATLPYFEVYARLH